MFCSQNDVDECASNPCLNDGTCTNQVNMYACSCVDGWTGDQCEMMVNTCVVWGDRCSNGGQCWSVYNKTFCA